MLADGIRVFDLRIGFLPPPTYRFASGPPSSDGTLIGFYHNVALLSPTAELVDVLYGFYKFLDDHPTETLMLSIKADNTTWQPSQFALEEAVYNLTTCELGQQFWVQDLASVGRSPLPNRTPADRTQVGTLGQARGKITLLNRLAYDSLVPTSSFPKSALGVHLPPALWTDNSPTPFSIPYNNATNASAFIEDYYEIQGAVGVDSRVGGKYVAVEEHLIMAANATGSEATELYITFSSAEDDADSPPVTPKVRLLPLCAFHRV